MRLFKRDIQIFHSVCYQQQSPHFTRVIKGWIISSTIASIMEDIVSISDRHCILRYFRLSGRQHDCWLSYELRSQSLSWVEISVKSDLCMSYLSRLIPLLCATTIHPKQIIIQRNSLPWSCRSNQGLNYLAYYDNFNSPVISRSHDHTTMQPAVRYRSI